MNLIKRVKNLWVLGNYHVVDVVGAPVQRMLIKDEPTIEKKLATIIPVEKSNPFEEEIKNVEAS